MSQKSIKYADAHRVKNWQSTMTTPFRDSGVFGDFLTLCETLYNNSD